MALTELEALRVYAMMMNTLRVESLKPLLADDFHYASQFAFEELTSKQAFLEYMRPKLEIVAKSGAPVFAEMGMVGAYGKRQPCVVLAQNNNGNLVGLVLARVTNDKLARLDLCGIPPP